MPPPGDALAHHASGFAKIMCSAVFITGLDPDFAAANVGYFASPQSRPLRPRDAYFMAGAGGQTAPIVPSKELVVVRLGHYKGTEPGTASFNQALALLMEAVPSRASGPAGAAGPLGRRAAAAHP